MTLGFEKILYPRGCSVCAEMQILFFWCRGYQYSSFQVREGCRDESAPLLGLIFVRISKLESQVLEDRAAVNEIN